MPKTDAELHRIAVSAREGMSEGGITVDGLRAVAAAAWDEAAVYFAGPDIAAKCERLNPYANALVTDERTKK